VMRDSCRALGPAHTDGRPIAAAHAPVRPRTLKGLVLYFGAFALLVSSFTSTATQARAAPGSFADLAEKLVPAVVNISTTQTVSAGETGPQTPFPPGSPFEEFFKDFFERQRPEGRRPLRRATSLGSGFIIDPEGIVVTNNHVIDEADEITVILQDGTRLPAEVVGRDVKIDIAVLKIEPKEPLTAIVWGDSEAARVGDWVLAIGNPFGLGGTVTAGIISARKRDINAGPYDAFIQTDAAINRGNSGGPLFNMNGEVIGINTAIISPSGGSAGIGFAVPTTLAKRSIDQIRKFGHTRRGWLGVNIQKVTDELAEGLGLDKPKGALVAGVRENSPAEAAGIQPGDVIVSFDGKDVPEMRALPLIVAETEVGAKVKVEVWRKGQLRTLEVTIGELEEAEKVAAASGGSLGKPARDVVTLGMKLAEITPALRERFELSDEAEGVVVTAVDEEGAAAEKGLRPGDVIVEVAQEEVATPADVVAKVEEVEKSNRKSVLLLVRRGTDLRFVAVRIEAG